MPSPPPAPPPRRESSRVQIDPKAKPVPQRPVRQSDESRSRASGTTIEIPRRDSFTRTRSNSADRFRFRERFFEGSPSPPRIIYDRPFAADEIVYRGPGGQIAAPRQRSRTVSSTRKLETAQEATQYMWDPLQSKDLTIHLELNVLPDLTEDLDAFSRLAKLGQFKAAENYFSRNLNEHADNPYVLVQYAKMLLDQGDYEAVKALEQPFDITGSRDSLNLNWLLIRLIAYFHTDGISRLMEEDNVRDVLATVNDHFSDVVSIQGRPIGSTEIEIMCLIFMVDCQLLALATHIHVPHLVTQLRSLQLYDRLLAEGRFWDIKDLFVSSLQESSMHETCSWLLGERVDAHNLVHELEEDWRTNVWEESTSLALLDTLVSLCQNALQETRIDKSFTAYLDQSYKITSRLTDMDKELLMTRPYLRWSLTKIQANTNKTDPIAITPPYTIHDGILFGSGFNYDLPIYVPRSFRPFEWGLIKLDSHSNTRIEVVLDAARQLDDYETESISLKMLILRTDHPLKYFEELRTLQRTVQGDMQGWLRTSLAMYALCNDEDSRNALKNDLLAMPADYDFGPALMWIRIMVLRALSGPDPKEPFLREAKALFSKLPKHMQDHLRTPEQENEKTTPEESTKEDRPRKSSARAHKPPARSADADLISDVTTGNSISQNEGKHATTTTETTISPSTPVVGSILHRLGYGFKKKGDQYRIDRRLNVEQIGELYDESQKYRTRLANLDLENRLRTVDKATEDKANAEKVQRPTEDDLDAKEKATDPATETSMQASDPPSTGETTRDINSDTDDASDDQYDSESSDEVVVIEEHDGSGYDTEDKELVVIEEYNRVLGDDSTTFTEESITKTTNFVADPAEEASVSVEVIGGRAKVVVAGARFDCREGGKIKIGSADRLRMDKSGSPTTDAPKIAENYNRDRSLSTSQRPSSEGSRRDSSRNSRRLRRDSSVRSRKDSSGKSTRDSTKKSKRDSSRKSTRYSSRELQRASSKGSTHKSDAPKPILRRLSQQRRHSASTEAAGLKPVIRRHSLPPDFHIREAKEEEPTQKASLTNETYSPARGELFGDMEVVKPTVEVEVEESAEASPSKAHTGAKKKEHEKAKDASFQEMVQSPEDSDREGRRTEVVVSAKEDKSTKGVDANANSPADEREEEIRVHRRENGSAKQKNIDEIQPDEKGDAAIALVPGFNAAYVETGTGMEASQSEIIRLADGSQYLIRRGGW